MRTVFSSQSQCAHVWAQQTQTDGKSGPLFFINTTDMYSYGTHYKAARIHTIKSKRFALVNSNSYSNSTAKHLTHIRRALDGLMAYFPAPNVDNPRDAVKYLDSTSKASIEQALRRSKVVNEEEIQYSFANIHDAHKTANQLRAILGMAQIWPKKKQLDEVKSHLEKRLERYRELNTPEMIEKRAKEQLKRIERKEAKDKIVNAEKIQQFYNGENVSLSGITLRTELLRIKGDYIQTSRGAAVPLKEAKMLYLALKAKKDVKGLTVGNFTVIGVYPHVNSDFTETKLIKIGCHEILLSEADKIFKAERSHLKLVSG